VKSVFHTSSFSQRVTRGNPALEYQSRKRFASSMRYDRSGPLPQVLYMLTAPVEKSLACAQVVLKYRNIAEIAAKSLIAVCALLRWRTFSQFSTSAQYRRRSPAIAELVLSKLMVSITSSLITLNEVVFCVCDTCIMNAV
jgi:hypothetical protein